MGRITDRVRYGADETGIPRIMEHERQAARHQGVHTMAVRVSRALGYPVRIENTGGHTMVATVRTRHGAIIAFWVEGYALYASKRAWQNGAEPILSDGGTVWEIVAEVTEWWLTLNGRTDTERGTS